MSHPLAFHLTLSRFIAFTRAQPQTRAHTPSHYTRTHTLHTHTRARAPSHFARAQGLLGYGRDTGPVGPDGTFMDDTGDASGAQQLPTPRSISSSVFGANGGAAPSSLTAVLRDADFSALPPAMRPMVVVLRVGNILVEHHTPSGGGGWGSGGGTPGGTTLRAPRAASVLFPLPYEDSNALPERAKIVRQGTVLSLGTARSESRDALTAAVKTLVSRQSRLESLHLLLKVSLSDDTKAQTVVCMRDGGFVGLGSHMNTFMLPLTQVRREGGEERGRARASFVCYICSVRGVAFTWVGKG